jgi:uncharacterized protein with GYD domain
MATFFMFGKYTLEGIKGMSAARTKKIIRIIKKAGGEVRSMHALLGEKDLVFIVDFPGNEEAIKASVAITKLTGIAFTTSPAVTVEEFDRIVS